MKKVGVAVLFLVFLPVLFLGVMGVDADRYRNDLARALSSELGRSVKIEGPLRLGFSFHDGFLLAVKTASIANVDGSRRPLMAKIGKLDLGINLAPLLSKKIVVSSFSLTNADVEIEVNSKSENHFDFSKLKTNIEQETSVSINQLPDFSISIERLKISNSRLVMYSENGETSSINIQQLTLRPEGQQIIAHYEGENKGIPLVIELTGDALDRLFTTPWEYKADVTYGTQNYLAQGFLKTSIKMAEVRYFRLTAGKSVVTGEAKISYGGARPLIHAKVISDRLDLADLSSAKDQSPQQETVSSSGKAASKRVFSDKVFDFTLLKEIDAKIDAKIDELVWGNSSLTRFLARLDLSKGRLILSPISMMFAGGEVRGQMKLETATPSAQLVVLAKASHLDLSQLVRMGGLESFLVGKGDFAVEVAAEGNSLHALAAGLNGQINLTMSSGEVDTKALKQMVGNVLDIAMPGLSALTEPTINCMAGRIKIINGLMQTKGILLDTSIATAFGMGAIHLGSEVITARVHTNGKIGEWASLIPAVKINGALLDPEITTEGGASIHHVAGALLTGKSMVGTAALFVPEIAKVSGQNACQYTLDHGGSRRDVAPSLSGSILSGLSNGLSGVLSGSSMFEGIGGGNVDALLQDLGTSLFGQ